MYPDPAQSSPHNFTSHPLRSNLILSNHVYWSPWDFLMKMFLCACNFLHRHYMSWLSNPSSLSHPNNTRWRIQLWSSSFYNLLHFLLLDLHKVLLSSLALYSLFASHRLGLNYPVLKLNNFNCILKLFFSCFRKTSFLVMSRCVIQSVYGERLKLCKTWLSRWSTVMSERWALFKLSMYYTYLSVISLPFISSMFDLMKKS